ncbi:MAG: hypothetical protein FMNOHCHN_03756 [Ignavibacteriaceae bacterium]|nr:hypothetical protein [Ignavibacteriaceae bacterium]
MKKLLIIIISLNLLSLSSEASCETDLELCDEAVKAGERLIKAQDKALEKQRDAIIEQNQLIDKQREQVASLNNEVKEEQEAKERSTILNVLQGIALIILILL